MKFTQPISLKELANFLNAPFKGDANLKISGINEIHMVEKGDVVFVDHPKYYNKALNSEADVILIDKEVDFPKGKGIIITEQPFDDFNKISKHHSPFTPWTSDRGTDVQVGKDTVIQPGVIIGKHVKIGSNCVIHSGAVIADHTLIGDEVVIGPNAVIGHDAFYYKKKDTGYDRMHSIGRVVLADQVEVGAMCTIDKGVTADTTIGKGTKIDNQVHIGHDTQIGAHCLFAANVGIAGCVIIEDHVTLWGQVGVASDITIGAKAIVHAQSGVSKNLKGGQVYFGSPVAEARTALKEMAALRKLPTIIESL